MSNSKKSVIDVKLADADSETPGSLPIRIEVSDTAISIYPQGFGDCGSADGHGCPLFIELYRGALRVIAFPDINNETPKIIDLNGAKENRRRAADNLLGLTPLQEGRRFHDFMSQTNPATGTPFTMKEAAEALDVNYATFRNLLNLWRGRDTRLTGERGSSK